MLRSNPSGKPAARATSRIAIDCFPRYATDSSGIARLPISKHGWQHIIVDYTVLNSSDALAEKEVVSSALVFELRR